MSKGALIIVSGPSGSGKDTVLKELFKLLPEIKFSISSVSRGMREGEVDGEKYNFISRQAFEEMIKNDMLLEYNVYCENYYGTPKAPVEKCIASGEEMILEVDVNGAANVRKKIKDCFSIFIMPPSFDVLKERLKGRDTETEKVVNMRLEEAKAEIERASEYDYVVVNDDLNIAVKEIADIIKSERKKRI